MTEEYFYQADTVQRIRDVKPLYQLLFELVDAGATTDDEECRRINRDILRILNIPVADTSELYALSRIEPAMRYARGELVIDRCREIVGWYRLSAVNHR